MLFKNFSQLVQQQFAEMSKTKLFRSSVTGDQLWDVYLASFKPKDNPVFRDPGSSYHNGNNDKNFMRRYGNLVTIVDNKIISIWDLDLPEDCAYYAPVKAMSNIPELRQIAGVFMEEFDFLHKSNYEKTNKNMSVYQLGIAKNFKQYTRQEADKYPHGVAIDIDKIYEFNHFHVFLPKSFVNFTLRSIESICGELNTTKQLFEKGLKIPLETLELVEQLIQQGSLLRGDMYLPKVQEFIKIKKQFISLKPEEQQNWLWNNFQTIPFARFANELIGTTCIDLAEGKDINLVCKEFNIRVDPTNYGKAKAPITDSMKKEAEKQIIDLGYAESFERRFATIDDINISEIKHTNIDNNAEKPLGLFAKAGVPTGEFNRHKKSQFDKLETVHIDKFMKDILPTCTSVEAFVENRFENNLVSLFTTKNKTAKNLLKWNNPFSWTYNGNLSGKSMIKDNVKAAGGKINGILRCSLQWNDEDTKGIVDYDLHCKTPFDIIYYANKRCHSSGGWLDVDMIRPKKVGVENITWQDKLPDGKYEFMVHTFCSGSNTGFKVEIEFDGQIFNYHYKHTTAFKSYTKVATVTVVNGVMSIKHHLDEQTSSKKLWNLDTNQFHKVSLICESPNHWGDNKVGTKEIFFFIQGCKTSDKMRAFHVDQLHSDLLPVRKAIDLLGNFLVIEPADKQLSGIGFNSTVKEELILKLKGTFERTIKVQF